MRSHLASEGPCLHEVWERKALVCEAPIGDPHHGDRTDWDPRCAASRSMGPKPCRGDEINTWIALLTYSRLAQGGLRLPPMLSMMLLLLLLLLLLFVVVHS